MRLVGASGEQIGIVSITDALRLAQEADLDLVEVAPTARPPVCKLMDYGKFKYESALKARESRKNQAQTVIKEIKIRPKIDPHDYGTKRGHVERFLRQGDKVKVTIMFRGREQSRPELGYRLLQQLAGDVEELGFVESQPKQDGRNMIMVIGPHRKKSEARAAIRAGDHRTEQEHQGRAATARVSTAAGSGESSTRVSTAAGSEGSSPRVSRAESSSGTATPAPRPSSPRPAAPRPAAPRPAAPRPQPPAGEVSEGSDGTSSPVSTAAPAAPRSAAPKPAPPRSAPSRQGGS